MFSGIVETIAEVLEVEERPHGRRLQLGSPMLAEAELGDSICVSGVCLTVAALSGSTAAFDVASETLRKTTLGGAARGSFLNLERSLRLGSRLNGHFVFGHVDCIAEVKSVESEGETHRIVIELPQTIAALTAAKGSIAVSGVSLTVGEVAGGRFSVYIVPYTFQETTFRFLEPGDHVNLEADMLARYVSRYLEEQKEAQ